VRDIAAQKGSALIHSSDTETKAQTTSGDLATPRDMESISPGQYAIPISMSQSRDASCLAFMNESIAWQCVSNTMLQLSILPPPGNSDSMYVKLSSPSGINGTWHYGHQPPDVQPIPLNPRDPATLPEAGAMTHSFRTTYSRVVLLKDNDFKNWQQPVERQSSFQEGDTLWRCVFDQTTIDGYIYANRTTASGPLNTTATTTQKLPKIPHVLKLVEQRMPSGKTPYCEKVKLKSGSLLAATDDGKTLLSLADPAAEAGVPATVGSRSAKFRPRQQTAGKFCSCQWTVQ
jgi:hypothetical protein